MKNFFSVMIKCKDEIYERRDRNAADVFVKVRDFVESGRYSSCKRASDIAKLTLRGLKDSDIAIKFDRSVETVRSEKRKISVELWSIFPADFFDNLLDYRNKSSYVDSCIFALNYWGSASDAVLLSDVVKGVLLSGKVQGNDYTIEELKEEIGVLRLYTRDYLETNLSMSDIDKLRYIIAILDGVKGDLSIKSEIIKRLTA